MKFKVEADTDENQLLERINNVMIELQGWGDMIDCGVDHAELAIAQSAVIECERVLSEANGRWLSLPGTYEHEA